MPDDERPVERDKVAVALRAAWEARQRALAGREELVARVEALLFTHDPIGIADGDNLDEYRSEAETIVLRLPGVTSEAEVLHLVHSELVRWFDAEIVGHPFRQRALAAEVWALVADRGPS